MAVRLHCQSCWTPGKGWYMKGNRLIRAVVAPVCLIALASSVVATAEAQAINLKAKLSGFNEVPPILTTGVGEWTATVDATHTSMTFTLTYSGLLADATQSHIHFGQPGVNGGV